MYVATRMSEVEEVESFFHPPRHVAGRNIIAPVIILLYSYPQCVIGNNDKGI